jgi:hypothetical protein
MSSWKPVLIGSFAHPVEAELACSKLQAEGIQARVADANTISIQPYYSAALGGVKLIVNEEDALQALRILKEDLSMESEETGASPAPLPCPRCGSTERRVERKAEPIKILMSWLLLGLPLPFLKKKSTCTHCGVEAIKE